jgi:hypothetical protein
MNSLEGSQLIPVHVETALHVKTVPANGTYLPKRYERECFPSRRNPYRGKAVNGPQFQRRGANKSDGMNNGKMHIIIGLPSGTCGREGPIPCVRHDYEYTLGCLISFGSKGLKPIMRPFLLRVDAY